MFVYVVLNHAPKTPLDDRVSVAGGACLRGRSPPVARVVGDGRRLAAADLFEDVGAVRGEGRRCGGSTRSVG
jgi:hypothetical protein